jgi:spermidine synthase
MPQLRRVIFYSFVLAFCGLTYELVLAQSLSVLLGNSVTQYSVTLGVFLAAMGAGALVVGESSEPSRALLRLQIILCLLAPASFFALWMAVLPHFLFVLLAVSVVAGVGFVTGMELPLLMQLAGTAGHLRVLAADYLGMLVASVAFPLYLLPHLGVFATILIAAILNGFVVHMLLPSRISLARGALVTATILQLILLFSQDSILEWLSTRFVAIG